MLITKFSMHTVHELLHDMEKHFWVFDKFEGTLQNKLVYIERTVQKCFKIFTYISYSCCITLIIRPLLIKGRRYPLMIYNIFDIYDFKSYVIMYCWQISNFVYGATVLLAIDGLYILFITNIYIQLEMLIHGFSTIDQSAIRNQKDEDICYRKIIGYVRHHNIILR